MTISAAPADKQQSERRLGSAPRPEPAGPVRAARLIVSAPLVFYQRVISPGLPRRCKYEPTCSRYAIEAIRGHGVLRGMVLAAWRLLRCNPWSDGGYDPVEAQRLFGGRPPERG